MKRNLLLLFFLLMLAIVHGQDTFSHWSVGLSAGAAFPVGGFANKHSAVGLGSGAGFAKTGIAAEIYGLYKFNRHFGAVLVAGGQENAIGKAHPSEPPTPTNSLSSIVTHNSDWVIGRILGGTVFDQPLSAQGRLSLRIRLLAGILKTSIPGYNYTLYSQTGSVIGDGYGSTTGLPWVFAYQADAGLTYKLPRGLSLVANTGYAGASSGFTQHFTIYNYLSSVPEVEKRTVPTGTIRLQVGVELAFP